MSTSLLNSGSNDARGSWVAIRTPRRAGYRSLVVGGLREESRGPWTLHASTRGEPVHLSDSRRETHSIGRQLVPITAARCYLIHMLPISIDLHNGCSCWSPDEENSPGFSLTMDAHYRLS